MPREETFYPKKNEWRKFKKTQPQNILTDSVGRWYYIVNTSNPIFDRLLEAGEIDLKTRFLVWIHLPRHALDPGREKDETLYADETLEFPEEKTPVDFTEFTNPGLVLGSLSILYYPERRSEKTGSFVAEIDYYSI